MNFSTCFYYMPNRLVYVKGLFKTFQISNTFKNALIFFNNIIQVPKIFCIYCINVFIFNLQNV